MANNLIISPVNKLSGEISIPGDKSISHRAIMLGAIAQGETKVFNFLNSADCIATINCFGEMGVRIQMSNVQFPMSNKDEVIIYGKGLHGLTKPGGMLDVGNSGTTIRLLSGILAGQKFESIITGDSSIQKRPMKRIAEPLTKMGAKIRTQRVENGTQSTGEICPPLTITGGELKAIEYTLPIASAQVKSCVLLAGLYAKGETKVIEPTPSRDHTERMLSYLGVPFRRFKNEVAVKGGIEFSGREVYVPGDISSAAYFMAAGVLVPDSDIVIRNVGTNPTRTGILEVFHRMGADIEVFDEEIESGEPRADIKIPKPSSLPVRQAGQIPTMKGIILEGEIIPRIIDEIPIIAVLATQAEGDTVIKDAKELRVKESDRIKTVIAELSKMGAKIDELPDGMVIHGKTKLHGAEIDSHGDHRIAMSMAIAGLISTGETIIKNAECIETSFPGFYELLSSISA